jgi:hypothetical protein
MKRLLLSTTAAVALFAPGSAKALLISIDADTLRDANGDVFPVSGLVVLTAATTSNTFLGPTPTSFATGSEIVLGTWDLSAFATPGVFSDITQNLAFGGDWGRRRSAAALLVSHAYAGFHRARRGDELRHVFRPRGHRRQRSVDHARG